jgi:hypothetical protein
MESVIGLFKTECITITVFHDGPYKTLADIEYATAGWVDLYNHRRLHGPQAGSPDRVRGGLLRFPQPRAATHIRAAGSP